VSDTETLLFIDDEQAEILELDVFGEESMSADDDVNLAGFDIREDGLLFG